MGPYIGDVLVVILMYTLIRGLWQKRLKFLPMYLLIFATTVEIAQYYHPTDNISLPLQLTGKVDLFAFDIAVTFDNLMLSFVEYKNDDDDVIVNYDGKTNTIHLNFLSSKNVSGEIDLCELVFKLLAIGIIKQQFR